MDGTGGSQRTGTVDQQGTAVDVGPPGVSIRGGEDHRCPTRFRETAAAAHGSGDPESGISLAGDFRAGGQHERY